MKNNMTVKLLLMTAVLLLAANLVYQFSLGETSYADDVKVYKVVPLSGITDLEKGINEYAGKGWTLLEVDGDTGNLIFYR